MKRAARVGALLVCVAVASGARADEESGAASPAPPPASTVRALHFEGVEAVPTGELRSVMATRRPDRWRFWRPEPHFQEASLEQDMERIERVYRRYGYYETAARYELGWDDEHRRVAITVIVDEGPPVRLAQVGVDVHGAPDLTDAERAAVVADLPLRPGDIFTLDDYRRARELVLERLADRAHPAAQIQGGADVDVETHEARVHWQVEPGPRVLFGPVTVKGLEDVEGHVVRRELRFHEGEPYSASALDRTRRRLLALQLFRYVSVLPQRPETSASGAPAPAAASPPAAPQVWPVVVEVHERPPRTIALGAGWGSDEGFRGSARWSHRNFWGDGRGFEIGGSASALDQKARVRLLQPYVMGTEAALDTSLDWLRRSRDSYDANEVTFTIGPRRSFGEHWLGEAAYRFGWTSVTNVQDVTDEVLREQSNSGFLSGVGLRFRRAEVDRPADPRRGTWLQLGMGTNLRVLGSTWDWMRYEADLRGYLPLGPTVAAARLQVRTIDPFGSTRPAEVPLSQRLFLGGVHAGRGFPYEKLGPLDANDEPVGGTSSVLASFEWRFPIWRRLSGSVFVDAGQVSLDPFDVQADEIGVGVGPGLGISTPIGPILFYAGYPVRSLETSQRWRFYLSVGHSF